MEQFAYLLWALGFFAVWLGLFLHRKDTRAEMIFISSFFGVGGLIAENVYVQDWWQPLTITGTRVGIEDFLIGFAIGGIASVLYTEFYRKRLGKSAKKKLPSRPWFFLFFLPILFLALSFFAHIHSFYATVIALCACLLYMLSTRRDLLPDSLISGALMMIFGIGAYGIILAFDPSFIRTYWYLGPEWYANLVLGIPLQEYIWYFLVGAYVGPLYEYLKFLRPVPIGRR